MSPSKAVPKLWFGFLLATLVYVVSIACTTPFVVGDAIYYGHDVLMVRKGIVPFSSLSDFGHILWRPLGYVLAGPSLAWIPDRLAPSPDLKITYGLSLLSLIAGLICTLAVFDLARRLTRSLWWPFVPVFLLVWGAAFLTYSQSGASYIPGLACVLVGLWIQLTARGPKLPVVLAASCLFGLAALLWMPFLYAAPAAWCARRYTQLPADREDTPYWGWREIALSAVATGVIVLAGACAAALMAGVHAPPQLVQWMVSAGHGMHQNRTLIRAVSGFVRLFIDLRHDGVYLKRFTLHDPYNPTSRFTLFLVLWKIALFYAFGCCVVALSWGRGAARRALTPLAIAAGLGAVAAVAVFEPSSPERLLPVLPFLLIAVSAGWNGESPFHRAMQFAIVASALLFFVINIPSFVPRFSPAYEQATAQISDFKQTAAPDDVMVTIVTSEPAVQWALGHPFENIRRFGAYRQTFLVNPIDADAAHWRNSFAALAFDSWCRGNNIWVEKAVREDAPEDQLMWVDGDNPAVRWKDLSPFFRPFDFDAATSRRDGFLRLARTPQNETRLLQFKDSGDGLARVTASPCGGLPDRVQ
jgi:hypothetical protein